MKTYRVAIVREGNEYFARQKDGIWRTRGAVENQYFTTHQRSGMDLAEYMFGKEEIAAIVIEYGITFVDVFGN